MSRIQSSVGIISGIPIEETVNKLLAIAARPRDLITQRNKLLQAEALAIDNLASLVLALQFDANKLKSDSLYASRTASSSDADAVTASIATGGTPVVGNYLFTPVQTASSHQLLSQSFDADESIGAGAFTFRFGGFVDQGIRLDELNGGAGIERGEIRITDRSGASAVIDLRFARTVDDVLDAINSNTTINVTAEAVGDAFRLTDNTGQAASNLIVQEVGGRTTAASLGLSGINVAANSATGSDVFTLHTGTKLAILNDGNGVWLRDGNDLSISLADETTLEIDLGDATTLGDVLDALNDANPAKLSAAISADGNRLELTDLTTGSGNFAVANVGNGTAASDLGLTLTASGDTITGRRLVAGLRDVLVSSLRGGQGLGTLGDVDITNRDGVSFTVDLSGAETLGQIVAEFNEQSTDVIATINAARNGILLTDTTGGAASNLIVADGDANQSATALGIVTSQTATSVNGGSLGRQIVSEATSLDDLNQGAGVQLGDIRIIDSNGDSAVIDLNTTGSEARTVGDVINAINAAGIGVLARINDAGDGILLVDTAEGTDVLTVSEVGNGRTAADLRLLGTAVQVDLNGTPTFVIDGTATSTVTIGAEDTLADLVDRINDLDAGVTASVVNDGAGQRLSLVSTKPGAASELLIDTSDSELSFQEISAARDAVLLYGAPDNLAASVLITSSSNTFSNAVNGVNLTVKKGSLEAVTVTVEASDSSLVAAVEDFVDAFNSVRTNLDTVTAFNETDLTTGILFGTSAALRVEADLNRLLSGRFLGVGEFKSLETIGISFDDEGKLVLDKSKLQEAFENDPDSLQRLFADESSGLAARLDAIVDALAGDENSALGARGASLADKIEANEARIEFLNELLERQRERLTLQFTQLETLIAGFQRSLNALSSLQIIPPLTQPSTK